LTAYFQVTLDPAGVATGRTPLDLNDPAVTSMAIGPGAIDWGQATVTLYEADGTWGSVPVDYRVPNRVVTIPLLLGAGDSGQAGFDAARALLQQKVALFEQKGGWLQRGDTGMYLDIVSASLTKPDAYGETGAIEPNVVLTLEAIPDFYGDEITLDAITATGVLDGVLKLATVPAVIEGDWPGRARIVVSDTSGDAQNGLLWGLRSTHYDAAATAKLVYEAEALTPVGGASVTALGGASGGQVISQASLPANSWVAMLSTNLAAGTAMTHQGSYRVRARVYSTVEPQLRFLWAPGSLSVPVINDQITVPGAGAFYLVDLGPIRVDPAPVGANAWLGAIQVYAPSGGAIYIDEIYYQPLDDGAGAPTYTNVLSAAVIVTPTEYPTAASDVSNGWTNAWSNPTNIEAPGAGGASVTLPTNSASEILRASGYGFAIPTGTTIVGIQVEVAMAGEPTFLPGRDYVVQLDKAGTAVGSNKATGAPAPATPGALGAAPPYQTRVYGGSNDLWGTTWTPSDINNATFGVEFTAATATTLVSGGFTVDFIRVTIYYEYSGFVIPTDAVIYPDETCQLGWDGMYRSSPSGGPYGAIANVIGDLPRIPASGAEGRVCELFVKPTRGDLNALADSGLDGLSVTVAYRPSWLFPA
jgi:hypothetical protein